MKMSEEEKKGKMEVEIVSVASSVLLFPRRLSLAD